MLTKTRGSFAGGIHLPDYCKDAAASCSIMGLPLPKRVVLPMNQHAGAPANPIVKKGDYVIRGQKVGESVGNVSVPVHASVSGTVFDVCLYNHPVVNQSVTAVIVDSDGQDKSVEPGKTYPDYQKHSPEELRAAVKEAGVVGLGGAAFPTHVKLSSSKDIDTVIANGCECEPYLTCDDRLLQEHMQEVVDGLKIAMYIVGSPAGIIAVEDNKPAAINSIKKIIRNEPTLKLRVLKTKYPQGAEKQLIKTVLNRTVPSGKLPFDVGVLVHNVGTCRTIYNAVVNGSPLTGRSITVTGDDISRPGNYDARLGTLLSEILAECGYAPADGQKIILGGPMMGIAQATLDVPVIKGTSSILVLREAECDPTFSPCIRCGKCIDACPMKLMPNMLSIYAENEFWDKAGTYSPKDCMECGCCAYVCVAKRPLVQHIKLVKLNTPLNPLPAGRGKG
ncbi:MAG: electron transport complex subunit RsxC [Candidatus Omnitrophota bacterium]